MPTARARTNRTTIGRWLGAATAAFALALLLGGLAAPLASAQTRQEAVDQANNFILWCVGGGGTPTVLLDNDSEMVVDCNLPNGSNYTCRYYPTVSCIYLPPVKRPPKSIGDQLGGEGGVATSDPSAGAGITDGQSGGVMSAKAADAGGKDQSAAHQHGHRHGSKPKPGNAANHHKAHAEKR